MKISVLIKDSKPFDMIKNYIFNVIKSLEFDRQTA